MMEDVEIIENSKEGRDKYGYLYGASVLTLTIEHIEALKDGKAIACNDGEYSTFVVLEEKGSK
jgi:hypothetical protein